PLKLSHGLAPAPSALSPARDFSLCYRQPLAARLPYRGLAISVPSESVAKAESPTSMPTDAALEGSGADSHSTEKHADQRPASRLSVTVLIAPSTGRCSFTLTCPTP